MTDRQWWLGYAKGKREFEVEDAIKALDIPVWCGHKIEFIRSGKKRRPEPKETPYLGNYMFLHIDPREFYEVRSVKHLASTMHPLNRGDVKALRVFQNAVSHDYAIAQRIIETNEGLSEYRAGQALKLVDGRFAEQLIKFKAIVERAFDLHPKIRAEVDMMGQWVEIELDPINVRACDRA